MASWTQAPPERDGWYWAVVPQFEGETIGVVDVVMPVEVICGIPMWKFIPKGHAARLGPRIPSPDEMAAMEEYIAASDEVESVPPENDPLLNANWGRFEAARSALKKIREGKP